MQSKDKQTKMDLMFYHKSLGLLMGGAVAARVGLRLASKVLQLSNES